MKHGLKNLNLIKYFMKNTMKIIFTRILEVYNLIFFENLKNVNYILKNMSIIIDEVLGKSKNLKITLIIYLIRFPK